MFSSCVMDFGFVVIVITARAGLGRMPMRIAGRDVGNGLNVLVVVLFGYVAIVNVTVNCGRHHVSSRLGGRVPVGDIL